MRVVGYYQDEHQGYAGSSRDRLPRIKEQPRCEIEALVDMVAQYLAGGRVVAHALGWGTDVFDPAIRTNIDDLTDGEWIWPGHALHYAETYSIVPPDQDFLDKVRSCGGVCPFPTDDELHEVGVAWFAGCDDPADAFFGDGAQDVITVEVALLDVDDATDETAGKVEGVEWSLDRLKAVVEPAIALGKAADYFEGRDRSEGLSGDRAYSTVYRTLCSPGGAIVVMTTAEGRYRVVRGRQWVTTARELGIAELPVTRQ